ncbi:CatB-related O-acetyltransferase [Aquirufa antheringensis]|uniref:CatB-related O-acetyltransferase n=1 Tax=Aquirufa antheringensis TaxID=2516559 RepID=UPI003BB170E7
MLRKLEYFVSKLIKKLHFKAILNSNVHRTSKVSAGCQLVGVDIGKYSDIGYDCVLINATVGSFCSFASNIIVGGANHTVNWVSTQPVFNENKDHLPKKFSKHKFDLKVQTFIGNDVWIGNNVLIKGGVTIGDGAIIGMGSVVTKNIPPYEIWAGNPAKCIKKRFDDDISNYLLNLKWWEWEDDKIEFYATSFNNIAEFIERTKSE